VPAEGAAVQARDGSSAAVLSFRDDLGSPTKHALIVGGRLAAVAALAAVFAGVEFHLHPSPERLGVFVIVTGIFFGSLQHAFAVTHFVLGSAVASATGAFVGLLATSAIAFWLPVLRIDVLPLVATAAGIAVVVPLIEHLLTQSFPRRRVLVIGPSSSAALLREELLRLRGASFEIVDIVEDGQEIGAAVTSNRPDIVVLASESRTDSVASLLDVRGAGRSFKVVGLTHFFEHAFGRVPPRQLPASWFLSLLHLRQPSYSRASKRGFDIVVALIGLLVTAPIWPVLVLLVRQSPGSLIFRQARVGEGGVEFTMYKFRTMRMDAEAAGEAVWAEESDPRVTFAGRFLRKTHLDELPQLWNVLKGEMSIVGPRPERPELLAVLEEQVPHWTRRLLVKPGMTGWAQMCRGYASDCGGSEEKLSYDLWYVRHRNLLLDIAICLRTLVPRTGAR
jgi:exopolysaccharide biosynthesis polyprenyl glycosylphosphotransferase